MRLQNHRNCVNFDLVFPSDGWLVGGGFEVHVRRWLASLLPETAASHRKPEITGATDEQAELTVAKP